MGEGGGGKGDLEKNADVTNAILKLIYTPNLIQVGQWESVRIRKRGKGHRGEFRVKKNENVTYGIPK